MTIRTVTFAAAALALCAPAVGMAQGHSDHGQNTQGSHGDSMHDNQNRGRSTRTDRARGRQMCPPGLRKKNTGCLPPGQWRRGDRLPSSWDGQFVRYSQLPYSYRSRNRFDSTNRYIYRDNRVYVVDAATRVIERVFGL
jgi:Ni/Co efflux regulator RcnB